MTSLCVTLGDRADQYMWMALRRLRRPQCVLRWTLYGVILFLAINILLLGKTRSPHEAIHRTKSTKQQSSQFLDYLADYLVVRYQVISNHGDYFTSSIKFKNTGPDAIKDQDWALYFYHPFHVVGISQGGILLRYGTFKVTHLNGDLYKLEPAQNFTEIKGGVAMKVHLRSFGACIAKTDISPNWYVAMPGGQTRVLRSTAGESMAFVDAFDNPRKWKKSRKDMYNPFTPGERYVHNNVTDMGMAPLPVIPQPLVLVPGVGSLVISSSWNIVSEPTCLQEATFLADKLHLNVSTQPTHLKTPHKVRLLVRDVRIPERHGSYWRSDQSPERYKVIISRFPPSVTLTAPSCAGLFYAVQTLLALGAEKGRPVPVLEVVDAPRFPYRGFMVDVARHFVPKEEMMRLIEVMAMYKLNKLHLHLADDEGWRIDIPGLPELVKVGSRRGHTEDESDRLLSQLGSGPLPNTPSSGFYTQDDYRDILRHALRHHIDVIPEIDLPGHAHAAIKSMLSREGKNVLPSQDYGAIEGDVGENSRGFLLSDFSDRSVYESVQGFNDNVVNPCLRSTFNFIRYVVAALQLVHADVIPLHTLHIGGDEVPLGALLRSRACGAGRNVNADVGSVLRSFQQDYLGVAKSFKLGVQAWDDEFFKPDGSPIPHSDVMGHRNTSLALHTRHSRWDGGSAHRPVLLANQGYKVIHAASTYLFLDHAQEPDPAERGRHWATRYIDTRRVFSFAPLHFYSDVDVDRNGKTMTIDDVCRSDDTGCPELEKPQNIIGMSAYLWTEMIRTITQLHQMTFPRLLAVAERSWHSATWEVLTNPTRRRQERDADWTRFANTLGYRELRRLEEMDIRFYLPPPGAVVRDGIVHMNSHIPGLSIEYSTDGGTTWTTGTKTIAPPNQLLMRTRSYTSSRRSRTISL